MNKVQHPGQRATALQPLLAALALHVADEAAQHAEGHLAAGAVVDHWVVRRALHVLLGARLGRELLVAAVAGEEPRLRVYAVGDAVGEPAAGEEVRAG